MAITISAKNKLGHVVLNMHFLPGLTYNIESKDQEVFKLWLQNLQ